MESLAMACLRRDCAYVAGWILGRFQISLSYEQTQMILNRAPRNNTTWGDGSWESWLKIRLNENHFFPIGCQENRNIDFVTAEFHIFFVQLEETPEMIALLPEEKGKKTTSKEARSKIFQTEQIPRPIDIVAQRVSNITSFLKETE